MKATSGPSAARGALLRKGNARDHVPGQPTREELKAFIRGLARLAARMYVEGRLGDGTPTQDRSDI
jgi:hypothetical protein